MITIQINFTEQSATVTINGETVTINNDQSAAAAVVSEPEPVHTPLTGDMLDCVANSGRTRFNNALDVAAWARERGITTVEDALRHSEVPDGVKALLEQYV